MTMAKLSMKVILKMVHKMEKVFCIMKMVKLSIKDF